MLKGITAVTVSLCMCIFIFSGCASGEEATIAGQVTAVDGNKVTIALVDMGNAGGGFPSGGQRPAADPGADWQSPGSSGDPGAPSGSFQPDSSGGPEAPSGNSQPDSPGGPGTPSGSFEPNFSGGPGNGGPNGDGFRQGGFGGGFELTGEEQTVTVPKSADITVGNADGSVSDITVGSFVRMTVKNGKAVSIMIMQGGGFNQSAPDNSGNSSEPTP